MNYDRPHEYSDVPSKDRLHKEKLSLLVEGEVPENYDPDQISWVTEDLGISDWEGAVNAHKFWIRSIDTSQHWLCHFLKSFLAHSSSHK